MSRFYGESPTFSLWWRSMAMISSRTIRFPSPAQIFNRRDCTRTGGALKRRVISESHRLFTSAHKRPLTAKARCRAGKKARRGGAVLLNNAQPDD